ncbi:hypothetical protein [Pueribacillus sp. YX66]|uniref:hypothetical protein n=1 Tax=Pueribacillus sp. YX66 TaxID=3229242 RepID=UPI00358CEE12
MDKNRQLERKRRQTKFFYPHRPGAPKADTSNVGDLYLDTKTGDVFEKNENGGKDHKTVNAGGGNNTSGDNNSKATTGVKLPKTASTLPTLMLIGAFCHNERRRIVKTKKLSNNLNRVNHVKNIL